MERAERLAAKHGNNGAGMPLAVAAKASLSGLARPTPTAGDANSSGSAAYSTASGRHSGTTLTDAAVLDGAERPVAPSHTHTLTLTTGETALLHAAPALVASVAHWEALAQRAEVERDTMRDDLESECRFAEGRRLERDALRAIIEGRTVPPTDAECVAVIAAGGWWRWVALEDGRPLPDVRGPLFDPRSVPRSALEDVTRREGRTYSERWWCLDAQRRPCAWPTTEAPR